MLFNAVLVSLIFTVSVQARATYPHGKINWYSCQQNASVPITCGTLTVPLDYTNHTSNKTLTLELVKVSAVKEPKKGSILLNPGGPGEGGRDFVAGGEAEPLLIATGGSFDLIGFDTRGTGNTIPFSCYPDAATREAASLGAPTYSNSSDVAIGRTWAWNSIFVEDCAEVSGDIATYVGTGFVARDMMQIVDALDEDGLLHYWGFSYGTALGEVVAAMFPERMGRVALDGVLNPYQYFAGTDVQEIASSDATFREFFTGCVADPDNCPLAQNGTTAEELEQKVYDLLYTLKFFPIATGDNPLADIIDYSTVKYAILEGMYNTVFWPPLAKALNSLLTSGSTAPFYSYIELITKSSAIYPNNGPEAIYGIRCSDEAIRTNNVTDLYPLIDEFYATSQIFGDIMTLYPLMCAQWPYKAKGRYEGNFQAKTKNPLLFVGNTYDPLTPLISAKNASAGFEGSVVLQHDGRGHSSLGQPSLCTAKAIRAFFENGTLPAPGTICEPAFGPFANKTILEAWAPIANFTKRANGDDEDAKLLNAWMRLSKKGSRSRKLF